MDPSHPPTLDYKSATTATAVQPLSVRVGLPLAIAFVALAFIVPIAILYYKSWHTAPVTPSAMVVVRGEAYYKGAQVRLEGAAGVFDGTLEPESEYTCSFHVPSGQYLLRVSGSGVTHYENVLAVRWRTSVSLHYNNPHQSAGPTTKKS